MRVTIDLPLPSDENVEEQLTEQFTHLIETCRGFLADYKKKGISTPTLSIRTNKVKVAKPSESKLFVDELLAYHLKRVPTANVPAQRAVLKRIYESGHTDISRLKALYDEKLKNYRDTSWLTIKYILGQPDAKERIVSDDLSFKRAELSEEAIDDLARRLRGE